MFGAWRYCSSDQNRKFDGSRVWLARSQIEFRCPISAEQCSHLILAVTMGLCMPSASGRWSIMDESPQIVRRNGAGVSYVRDVRHALSWWNVTSRSLHQNKGTKLKHPQHKVINGKLVKFCNCIFIIRTCLHIFSPFGALSFMCARRNLEFSR